MFHSADDVQYCFFNHTEHFACAPKVMIMPHVIRAPSSMFAFYKMFTNVSLTNLSDLHRTTIFIHRPKFVLGDQSKRGIFAFACHTFQILFY
ncbi:hypothetical protein ILYODFUR_013973 [Ilyodon furcidens]|uniref:Uncharacterized protein n=1 Tax=Ilyodon furcidens TaxID=33524 RepID=A0ABV0SMQ6_9TELE